MIKAIIILLFPVLSFAQSVKIQLRKQIAPASLVFVAGMADGLNNALSFKWSAVQRVFPGIDQNYWWPSKSWDNKYKGGRKENGERFPGSSTVFVSFSDGYHLTRFVEHMFLAGALTCKVTMFQKQKWYVYVLEGLTYWAINRIGFFATYSIIFK